MHSQYDLFHQNLGQEVVFKLDREDQIDTFFGDCQ